MRLMAVIALDLGATKLAGAIVGDRGRTTNRILRPLEGRAGNAVGALVGDTARALLAAAERKQLSITGVGACVPGIAQPNGRVWAPNIRGWTDYPLRRELRALLPVRSIPVAIESDRACYILGETWRGAARGCRDAIYLAVGTGIGAGIMSHGQVLQGAHGVAGSIGWLALERPFRTEYSPCGCFEYYASGAGLANLSPNLPGEEVFAAFDRGDPTARAVLSRAIEFWGMAVANLVSMFNPTKIIFGGGVFGPAARFLDDIAREARKWAQPVAIRQVKLEPSRLGGDAGLYGAAYLALRISRKAS